MAMHKNSVFVYNGVNRANIEQNAKFGLCDSHRFQSLYWTCPWF